MEDLNLIAEEKEPSAEVAPLILIVDDNVANTELLDAYLTAAGYRRDVAYDGEEALQKVEAEAPDLILLDVMLPHVNGYEVCQRLKDDPDTRLIPIIMLTALQDLTDKIKGIEVGADEFLTKPFNKEELLTRVRSLLKVKKLNDELDSAKEIIMTLALALEASDPYLRGHSERVAEYGEMLAKKMGLPKREFENIKYAGVLHDIGKIGIDTGVLHKPKSLSHTEYEHIKTHPVISVKIVEPLRSIKPILPLILYNHEKYDGTGYPHGLKGDQIPLGARIIAIADSYDAMTSDRAYRTALTKEQAFLILQNGKGKHWDPVLVDTFIELMSEGT